MKKRLLGSEQEKAFLKSRNIPLSPAVQFGNLLFVSGQPPLELDKGEFYGGDIEKQTEIVLENLKSKLEEYGSSLNHVLKTTVYACNSGHYNKINQIYEKYFGESMPARTFVAVGSFNTGFDIEIECIAYIE